MLTYGRNVKGVDGSNLKIHAWVRGRTAGRRIEGAADKPVGLAPTRPPQRVFVVNGLQREFSVCANHHQQIIEVMRRAAGESRDRLQVSGLRQLRLQCTLLRQVLSGVHQICD